MHQKSAFKIDIGPMMSARSKDYHITHSMQSVLRELNFDADMTKMLEIKKFMVVACQIIEAALRGELRSTRNLKFETKKKWLRVVGKRQINQFVYEGKRPFEKANDSYCFHNRIQEVLRSKIFHAN